MPFQFLATWWRHRSQCPVPVCVRMYTRAGCHLCADAWQLLQEARERYPFSLEAADIGGNPDLLRQFGERVPVVEINGQVRCWGRINRVLLERSLRAAARRTDP